MFHMHHDDVAALTGDDAPVAHRGSGEGPADPVDPGDHHPGEGRGSGPETRNPS